MTSPNEFRELADECLARAKSAKSDRERQTFLQMASAWTAAHQSSALRGSLGRARKESASEMTKRNPLRALCCQFPKWTVGK
jgi:hypothetical protein